MRMAIGERSARLMGAAAWLVADSGAALAVVVAGDDGVDRALFR